MNKETLLELEEKENVRVRGVERLAILWDKPFNEVEKLVDKMNGQLKNT